MRSGSPQRTLSAFSPHHYSSSNDPLSQPAFLRAKECSAITATKPKRFRPAHIRDSHPIPLFSWNKNACPFGTAGAVCTASASVRVAHLPQKPVIDSFFIFVFAFPAKRQKRLPFLRQSASITYILFLYMAVSTCLTSISRKVPPSELPAAVTGISFLPAYLFALMYASAPEKF